MTQYVDLPMTGWPRLTVAEAQALLAVVDARLDGRGELSPQTLKAAERAANKLEHAIADAPLHWRNK